MSAGSRVLDSKKACQAERRAQVLGSDTRQAFLAFSTKVGTPEAVDGSFLSSPLLKPLWPLTRGEGEGGVVQEGCFNLFCGAGDS